MRAKIIALVFVLAMALAAPGLGAFLTRDALAAEAFGKLNGSQIRAKVAGMEIADDVHWRDVYERSGTLTSYAKGRVLIGKWWVGCSSLSLQRLRVASSGIASRIRDGRDRVVKRLRL